MCLWKGNGGFEKEKFVLLSQKKNWKLKEREMKKNKKKEVWKKVAIRLGVQIMKIEMSLGEVYVSWKRILWKSDYDEMFQLSQDIWIPLSYSFN